MKKLIVTLLTTLSLCFGDTITDNKINEISMLIKKQDLIAGAVDTYIALYGTIPANVNTLKTANLLGADVVYTGTLSVNGASKLILLSDTITAPETYQSDFYLNTNDRSKYSTHTVVGTSFNASYPFTSKATFSYLSSSSMVVSPTAPSSPVNGTIWLNSLTKQIYYYASGWLSVNPRKLWIVRDIAELPTSASVNDGAIIHDGTNLSKYLHNGTTWILIPQAIPFTYNGTF